MKTPIAIIIFNRPDKTEKVLAELSKIKPEKLFVIADGPRKNNAQDVEKCQAARDVFDRIDWKCEVFKNYSDINLGCGYRPATGISWVFENVEEAIIIEDDCIPDESFFYFCEEMLHKYRDDERIMQISGFNSLIGEHSIKYSYSFYRLFACQAWATWRRAWQYFDMKMELWPILKNTTMILDNLGDPRGVDYFNKIFDEAYEESSNIHYWDYQFLFACWSQSGLAIFPRVNMFRNIGYGADGTHVFDPNDKLANLPVKSMDSPLNHPPYLVWESEIDQKIIDLILSRSQPPKPSLSKKVRRKISKLAHGKW